MIRDGFVHCSYMCLVFAVLEDGEPRVEGKDSRKKRCSHNVNRHSKKAYRNLVSTILGRDQTCWW